MIVEEIFCHLAGDHFSPQELVEKTGLYLEDRLEVGQPKEWGKKLPSEYGKANLVVPKELPEDMSPMTWITNTLANYYPTMRECGVEEFEITVLIDSYTGILNWGINHENMKILGNLGISISFSASYKEDNLAQIETDTHTN